MTQTMHKPLKNNPAKDRTMIWCMMVLALGGAIFICMQYGASDLRGVRVLLDKAFNLTTRNSSNFDHSIILNIRMPRVLLAAVVGCSLGAAGVLSQGLFRNALASPSVLGASAGAASFAAFGFYLGLAGISIYMIPALGMAGAAFVCSILWILSNQRIIQSTTSLLLVGFALNALFSSVTALIISLLLQDHQQSSAALHWLMGSFSGRGWEHFVIVSIVFVFALPWALRLTRPLDILTLGEDTAESLGVSIKQLRSQLIIVIALLVGSSISIAGGIPFVGLIVPHISRKLIGPNHTRLMIASCINGATLTLVSDLAARTLLAPREMNVGILVSLIGASFFVYLLIQSRKEDANV